MSCTVRLLGPDLATAINVTINSSSTVSELKQEALAQWPLPVDKAPGLGQLKVIYHGSFLEDTKSLKDARVPEGELTTLHVVVKPEKSKDSNGSGDDKTPKCTCVVC